jgi:hypothetical protein
LSASTSASLYFKDIDIKGGYQSEDYTMESVAIYTNEKLTYSIDSDNFDYKRSINLKWLKDFDGKFINIDSKEKLGKNLVQWYTRINEEKDENNNEVWTEVPAAQDLFSYTFSLSPDIYKYSYKIIITNLSTEEKLESNIITFNRVDELNGSLQIRLMNSDNTDTYFKVRQSATVEE